MTTATHDQAALLSLIPSDEERALRETVAQIAAVYNNEYYAEKAKAKEPLTELKDALVKSGFVGVSIPSEYGGGGMGIAELAIIVEEIAAAGCPMGNLIITEAIASSVLVRHASAQQKAEWLPRIPTGELAFSFAITEPDAGSNSHNIKTTVRRENGKIYLSGAKTYISAVESADKILVVARSGIDEKSGRGLLTLVMIDADAPGLEKQYIPVDAQMSEKQWQLFFDNVEVNEDDIVGAWDGGFRAVFDGLNPERITGAASALGIGRYALAKASAYANQRNVWGVPIGSHQGVAHPLAEAKIQLDLAELMTRKAAALYDSGLPAGEASNMAKFAAAEAAYQCLDRAIQTHGGNGIASEYGLANLWGVTRLLRIAPVSREMILNFVAEHTLKLPRSY